jgi:hypothetical protein
MHLYHKYDFTLYITVSIMAAKGKNHDESS